MGPLESAGHNGPPETTRSMGNQRPTDPNHQTHPVPTDPKKQADQRMRPIMVIRTPRDTKSPQEHGKGRERKGLERESEKERERKRERKRAWRWPKGLTPPPPPPARICLKRGKSHPANNPSKAGINPRKLPRRMRHHTAQGQREEGQA